MTNQTRRRPGHLDPGPLISLRTLAIFTASVLVGAIAAAVTYVQVQQISHAVGIGGLSALGVARQLHSWTGT